MPAADEPAYRPHPTARPRRRPVQGERFPIVALGGSAGGLEALEQFFTHLPPEPGMAFVVVLHRPPSTTGQDDGLLRVLQSFSPLPVRVAEDSLRVQPNQVYLIPPDRDLGIQRGTLVLETPQPDGQRQPIDFFLQNLAKDVREYAVCVILSGMNADGSTGLKMVMENFGLVMVQDPTTALYDTMPRAALATEFADYVLPPELMPARLVEYAEQMPLSKPGRFRRLTADAQPVPALERIYTLLREQVGHDFAYYKRNTVLRRIERRMTAHQIKDIGHYVQHLQENPQEVEQLFRELLIGVTKFFRDAEAFESLKHHLQTLLRQKPTNDVVRVWAPGCSTGEEAYSLAMILLECLDELGSDHYLKIQLFATDISPEAIETARAATYRDNIGADISPARLRRFFTKLDDGSYQIRKEVRDLVVFAVHNVSQDAPFTRLDLLVCRNLLIYLGSELQKGLFPIFHYALNPGGLLFLGPSENLTGFQELFAPLDVKWKISRRTEAVSPLTRIVHFPFATSRPLPTAPSSPGAMTAPNVRRDGNTFATLVQRLLLLHYAPPAVLINPKGEILFINGRTGKYLEPAPGLSGMNLFDMAREELNFEISGAVHRAHELREDVRLESVRVRSEGGTQLLRLTVKYLHEPETLAGLLLVAFEDQPTPRRLRKNKVQPESERDALVTALEKELQYTKHRLQATIEEMESSLEELKSTNEELQSANEELQSTNEEAMTNREEMQSLNEELMTLNMQYLAKTEELSQAANDMKNLLDSTEIAIIFLDNDMVIKRFTPPVSRIINLVPADVGRPLTHFASNLRYEHLVRDVEQVLHRLVSVETTIQSTTGEWYAMRILPYRTLDNYISGAVITFTDITHLKQMEEQLRASARLFETLRDTTREPVLVLDGALQVVYANRAFAELTGLTSEELTSRALEHLAGGTWNQPSLRRHLGALLDPAGAEFDDLTLEVELPGHGRHPVVLYGRRLAEPGAPLRALLGVKTLPVLPQP